MGLEILENRRFLAGEIVIREGEASYEAFLIRSGTVEVLKEDPDGGSVRIAVLEPGEIFGEMGLILDSPRTATVRARDELSVDVIDPDSIRVLLDSDVGRNLKPFFQILCERLRLADARLAQLVEDRELQAASSEGEPTGMLVCLLPKTAEAKSALGGKERLDVCRFPFLVGGGREAVCEDPLHMNDLWLVDSGSPRCVSRSHFALVRSHNTCHFLDRGSRAGSLVNGQRVGGGVRNVKRVQLNLGHNSLRLGGVTGGLGFYIVVSTSSEQQDGFWHKLRGHLHLPHW